MKIHFQNPTKGPLITVSFDDEATAVGRALSIAGISRTAAVTSKVAVGGLRTLRAAAQFAEAAPSTAGGGAMGGAGVAGVVGPLALIGMFFASGDVSRPSHLGARTPIIGRPPTGVTIPQWIATIESAIQIALEIDSLQHQIRLMKDLGLGHLTFTLQQRLDNLTVRATALMLHSPTPYPRLHTTASAASGDAAPNNANNSVTQVKDNIYHAEPLEQFRPSRRAALLINLQDALKPNYSWNPMKSAADRHLADLEIALAGHFGELPPTDALDSKTIAGIQEELRQSEFAYDHWANELQPDTPRQTALPIEKLVRIFPDQDFESTFAEAVKDISTNDPQQLIYIAILAHGVDHRDTTITHGGIAVGNKILLFAELISFLDTIPGKKVLILSSCYSGNLVEHIARHSRRTDYAVIADTSPNEISMGINQMCFIHELTINIIDGRPLSRLRWDSYDMLGKKQTPSVFVGFDAVL